MYCYYGNSWVYKAILLFFYMGYWPVVKRVVKDSDIVLFVLDARMPEMSYNKSLETMLKMYKKEIVKALKWYEGSKESKDVFREKGFMIINAKDEVLYTIIGTIASILSRSNDVEEGTYIMGLARTKEENNTKVSLRIGGKDEHEGVDLRQVVTDVVERVGFGEAGGHPLAAGAIIPFEKEEEFISAAKVVLRERVGKKVS